MIAMARRRERLPNPNDVNRDLQNIRSALEGYFDWPWLHEEP